METTFNFDSNRYTPRALGFRLSPGSRPPILAPRAMAHLEALESEFDIARVDVKVQQTFVVDSYARNRSTGSFIVIDENTHSTVAAGMIV